MNDKRKRFLLFEGTIILIIILSSFIIYTHVLCPSHEKWETSFFSFTVKHYSSVQMYCFQILLGMSYVFIVIIWYVTCKYWWRRAILMVLLLSVYQFLIVVFAEVAIDKSSYFYKIILYALTFFIGLFVMWFRKGVNYPLRNKLYVDAIDAEEILRYKFKNTKHYTTVLNSFTKEIYSSGIQNTKTLIANAFLLAEEEGGMIRSKSEKKQDWVGILIFFTILSLPVLCNLFRLAPRSDSWDLGFFELGAFNYASVSVFLWLISMKLSVFITITIWFLSATYWWKYSLLIPLVIVSCQIVSAVNIDVTNTDENEVLEALPVLVLLTSFLLWLSFKINNYTKVQDLKRKIKVEIFEIVSFLGRNGEQTDVKEKLNKLIEQKEKYAPKEYLKELEELKKVLIEQNKHLS